MAVKKKGEKWYPVGKKGNLWKTGYPTEAKAKKGLAQANKYFRSMKNPKKKSTKKSGSKKTTTKKKATKKKATKKPKKVIRTTKKRSWVGYARLGIYVLTTGGAAIDSVARHGFTKEAAAQIVRRYSATDGNGHFSAENARIAYTAPAVWAVIDTAASKLGVYKRMGSL